MKTILIIILVLLAIPTILFMCTVGSCSYKMAKMDMDAQEYKSKVSIEKWDWHQDGGYFYINGRAKNNGDKVVRYFEVHIEFMDSSGRVIDTTLANSGENMNPGASKNWDTMQKADPQVKTARAFIGKVSVY
jgi:hypothetical protein